MDLYANLVFSRNGRFFTLVGFPEEVAAHITSFAAMKIELWHCPKIELHSETQNGVTMPIIVVIWDLHFSTSKVASTHRVQRKHFRV